MFHMKFDFNQLSGFWERDLKVWMDSSLKEGTDNL